MKAQQATLDCSDHLVQFLKDNFLPSYPGWVMLHGYYCNAGDMDCPVLYARRKWTFGARVKNRLYQMSLGSSQMMRIPRKEMSAVINPFGHITVLDPDLVAPLQAVIAEWEELGGEEVRLEFEGPAREMAALYEAEEGGAAEAMVATEALEPTEATNATEAIPDDIAIPEGP